MHGDDDDEEDLDELEANFAMTNYSENRTELTEAESAYIAQFEAANRPEDGADDEDAAGDEDVAMDEEGEDDMYLPPGGDWRTGPAGGRRAGGGSGGVKGRLWISAEARERWQGVLQGPAPHLASVSLACVAFRMQCKGFGLITDPKGAPKLTRDDIELHLHSWCHATAFGSAATAKGRSTQKKKGSAKKKGGR